MDESPRRQRIVIVGGGLAGCTAALALAREPNAASRFEITLIESKSRLGGRVGSYTDQASGLTIDYCQHVGMNCCSALKQLIEWLDQKSLWRVQSELYFYGPQQERQRLTALPFLPAPLHLSGWLWNWPGLTWSDRLQIARGMLAINRIALTGANASKLENVSADQWLRSHGQADRVRDRFWSTIIVSALGEQLDRVGLLPVAKVFQDGFLRARDAYHLLVPERPLDELFGRRFHETLEAHAVDVRLSTSIVESHWQGDRCQSVTLTDGQTLEPDQLIIAVPWHAVGQVVAACEADEVKRIAEQAGQISASPISGVHTWWDRPWLPTPHAALVGRLCQWIFPHASPKPQGASADWPYPSQPGLAPHGSGEVGAPIGGGETGASTLAPEVRATMEVRATSEQYYQIVISASRMLPRGDTKRVAQLIEEDLREVFVEARDAKLLRVRVVTDPQAVFSVAPGTGSLRPQAGSFTGNLCWAGDWTDTGWPATMEGAIRSGMSAATAVALLHQNATT